MSIGQTYPSIVCTTSIPENPKLKVEAREKNGGPQISADDILGAHWSLQPPRLQTRIYNPRGLRTAVHAALRFDGNGPEAPPSLPFSGNFLIDKTFALSRDTRPLLEGVQALIPAQSSAQKADCALIAQQLVQIIADTDGFAYVRQGAGSPLQGSKTVTGWYFHYVCDGSRECLSKRNDCCDCKGSIYVSMSAERMYVYYTHRDWHESTAKVAAVQCEEPSTAVPVETYPMRALPTPSREPTVKPIAISQTPVSPPESSPLNSPFSVNGSDIIAFPDATFLPDVHPTPVEAEGSVYRNYKKLRALRDLVEVWLPEDGEGTDNHVNPFLRPIFGFMIEWFKTAMDCPGMQQEIYRILDLGNNASMEEFLHENGPVSSMSDAGGKWSTRSESLRQSSIRSRCSHDTEGSECSLLPSAMAGGSWRHNRLADLFKLEYGGLSSAETPVRTATEKRKSGDMSDIAFRFGGRKKKNRTGL